MTETETDRNDAAKPVHRHAQAERHQQGDHRDHHHAFTDPAALAEKWNDPARDKWQRPEEIVAALDLKPGATVADIGAGTGYMVAHLSRAAGEQGTVLGLDASPAMVEYLRQRSDDLGPAKIVARQVGTDNPELLPASVDAVLTLDTWHHVEGREAYARKVYAGLKRSGRFVIVDYEPDSAVGPPPEMRLKAEQVLKELEAAGFRAEVVEESMPRHFVVVGHKDKAIFHAPGTP